MSNTSKDARLADAARTPTVFDDQAEAGARVYAEALLNIVARDGQADAALDELDEIVADVLDAHPQFEQLVTSPTLAESERDRMLMSLFDGRALPTVVKFLRVLNRHGRMNLLRQVVHMARNLWNERQNRRAVTVTSAVALDETQVAALRERLQALTGSTPVLSQTVDPELLGGMVVQVGDIVYDSSIRTRLSHLRRQLVDEKLQRLRGTLAATASNT